MLKRLIVGLSVAAGLATWLPASGLADQPVIFDHGVDTFGPYPTNFCGVPGTAVDEFKFTYREDADGDFIVNEIFTGVFTATATGRSLEVHTASTAKVTATLGEGTITFVEHNAGVVIRFKIPNGPVLKAPDGTPILGAGVIDAVAVVDASTGELISLDETVHGPHPIRDGVDICGPAIAYLTS
jgi:hypothetical protein